MRFCDPHWADLRKEIDTRGLSAFVSRGGEALAKKLVAESDHGSTQTTFDPLMFAHNAILGNVMRIAGLAPLLPRADDGGDHCPLCFMVERCPCDDTPCGWSKFLGHAADDALTEAKRLGLMGAS